MKKQVSYEVATGGPHSEMGFYRINPVTSERRFSVWRGLGTLGGDRTIIETVCTKCGEALDPKFGDCPNGCH